MYKETVGKKVRNADLGSEILRFGEQKLPISPTKTDSHNSENMSNLNEK